MLRIGLTGGIGMGKSAAAEILGRGGLPVVDSDMLAREVVAPGQPALDEIKETFGAAVVDERGFLRREELARLVFNDPAARRRLEAITHPRIQQAWQDRLRAWQDQGSAAAVACIPLLFETGGEAHFDVTLCVACSPGLQKQRLQTRGWSDEMIQRRQEAQWPVWKKMNAATFVVWNDGSLSILEAQLRRTVPFPETLRLAEGG